MVQLCTYRTYVRDVPRRRGRPQKQNHEQGGTLVCLQEAAMLTNRTKVTKVELAIDRTEEGRNCVPHTRRAAVLALFDGILANVILCPPSLSLRPSLVRYRYFVVVLF